MSGLTFNDTATKMGLIQDCETALFGDNGYTQISGNPTRLLQFTARINSRLDDFVKLAMEADGRWDFDDTNNTDYPEATTNIISGQRDYTFALEMLMIEKVLVMNQATNGVWMEIGPMGLSEDKSKRFVENNTWNTGLPYRYVKRGNSVFLDPVPNYSVTNGLKVLFKRGGNYFASTDTTKAPGFASILHKYLSRGAALDYAMDRTMSAAIATLTPQVEKLEKQVINFFSRRTLDERKVLGGRKVFPN